MKQDKTAAGISEPIYHKFNVDEFYKMLEVGIFTEDDRVELIEGEILDMDPMTPRHASRDMMLNRVFQPLMGDRAVVSVHNPVRLSRISETLPDIALLAPPVDRYKEAHPTPDNIPLLIEVADASLAYDREVKLPLYARHAIPEVWLVNLVELRIEVFREPSPQGYRAIRYAFAGDAISPAAFPDIIVRVDEVLA